MMKHNKSIALIICYYGKIPWYFKYFVHSFKYNPDVDLFIITDEPFDQEPLPGNIKIIRKTLSDFNVLATEKLGFRINVSRNYAYKLSEFKPAGGLLFSELLDGYDFWGYIDIDVIWGNIRDFITDELMGKYDLISGRPEWMPGCFSLYKNTDVMNTLFMQSKDYVKAFTDEQYLNFDETGFKHSAFIAGNTNLEINGGIESMMHVVQKATAANKIKPLFDFFMIEGLPGRLKWENGYLYYKNRYEVLLFHMMYLKDIYTPKKQINYIPDTFNISSTKIYHRAKSKLNGL
ncbi:DUF6625 family protein [Mucilaginibacter angelicae]|uniref:DUF6625 family protein n=1 Tax=Mucilaginibacter angelicae TaxID=869718 RepID=A0ABV6L1K9_9SPHI